MLSFLLLALAASSALSADVINVQVPEIIGDYKLMFTWPKTTQHVPNCSKATYKYQDDSGYKFSCECGDKNARLALLREQSHFIGRPVFFYIVNNYDEAVRGLADSCKCQPINFKKVIVQKLSDNLMLQYEQEEILRHYIFAKEPPTEAELRDVIAALPNLKYDDGMLVCKEE